MVVRTYNVLVLSALNHFVFHLKEPLLLYLQIIATCKNLKLDLQRTTTWNVVRFFFFWIIWISFKNTVAILSWFALDLLVHFSSCFISLDKRQHHEHCLDYTYSYFCQKRSLRRWAARGSSCENKYSWNNGKIKQLKLNFFSKYLVRKNHKEHCSFKISEKRRTQVSAIFCQIFIFSPNGNPLKNMKMFFISSKKFFSFSRYSNFCSVFPSLTHFPDQNDKWKWNNLRCHELTCINL